MNDRPVGGDVEADVSNWYDLLPWREWRAGPQRAITDLVARELASPPDNR